MFGPVAGPGLRQTRRTPFSVQTFNDQVALVACQVHANVGFLILFS